MNARGSLAHRLDALRRPGERRDVGVAEAVDALLGIADDAEDPRPQRQIDRFVHCPGNRFRSQQEQHVVLEGIGVLKLVHQDAGQLPGGGGPQLLALLQVLSRQQQQVMEGDLSASCCMGRKLSPQRL